jgi:hypothetical protein
MTFAQVSLLINILIKFEEYQKLSPENLPSFLKKIAHPLSVPIITNFSGFVPTSSIRPLVRPSL